MHHGMEHFDAAVRLLEDDYHLTAWLDALAGLEADAAASSYLRGLALRRLHDAQRLDDEATATRLSLALSPSVATQAAGQWLEGFLTGAAQVLIHDPGLLAIVDQWLCSVPESAFMELLPVLRRAVGSFDAMERRRLLEQVRRGPDEPCSAPIADADETRTNAAFAAALPLLNTILGREHD